MIFGLFFRKNTKNRHSLTSKNSGSFSKEPPALPQKPLELRGELQVKLLQSKTNFLSNTLPDIQFQFDTSAFTSKKTGRFKFPKYKITNKLFPLKDETDYRDYFLADLEPSERKTFGERDFLRDLDKGLIEFDDEGTEFETAFLKLKRSNFPEPPPIPIPEIIETLQETVFCDKSNSHNEYDYTSSSIGHQKLFKKGFFKSEDRMILKELRKQLGFSAPNEIAHYLKENSVKVPKDLSLDDALELVRKNYSKLGFDLPLTPTDDFFNLVVEIGEIYVTLLLLEIRHWHWVYIDSALETLAYSVGFIPLELYLNSIRRDVAAKARDTFNLPSAA